MSVMELYEKRGSYTARDWLELWVISARVFALPWVVLFTLFGGLLVGVSNWVTMGIGMLIVALVTMSGHFINNFRDVELGIDKFVDSPERAKKTISTLKPYTAASWLVPLRITSIRFQKLNAIALALIAFILQCLFMPLRTWPAFIIGSTVALTYTDFFKRKHLGEVAAFLGHGFSTVLYGVLSQSTSFLYGSVAAVPPALLSSLAYSVDQFIDIKTDFVYRVRSIYESWFNSKMPISLYVIIALWAFIMVVIAWVAAEIYPKNILLIMAIIPLILYYAPMLDWDRENGLQKVAMIATFLIPGLFCLGAILP